MKITDDQVRAAEEIASDVFDKQLTVADGSAVLANTHGLNINSARDFINDYKYMMHGKLFQRAMSAPAINYFLTKIREKRGDKHHALAISAVDQHLNYYEQLRKTKLNLMRSVMESHKKDSSPLPLVEHAALFNEAVQDSLKDTSAGRKARLKDAPKVPTKVPVVTYAFVRNPDVVAEVLLRASGICERCSKEAPFRRKTDSQPYLEVHHKVQLSKGGEDTVDNALALCPNCHRYSHFGLEVDELSN
jgi:5-methylcytosine-specific restriction protein A